MVGMTTPALCGDARVSASTFSLPANTVELCVQARVGRSALIITANDSDLRIGTGR